MKKHYQSLSSPLIIAATSIALAGLIIAQVYLINRGIYLSEQLFTQQVNEALSNVSRKLEDAEHVGDAVMIASKQKGSKAEYVRKKQVVQPDLQHDTNLVEKIHRGAQSVSDKSDVPAQPGSNTSLFQNIERCDDGFVVNGVGMYGGEFRNNFFQIQTANTGTYNSEASASEIKIIAERSTSLEANSTNSSSRMTARARGNDYDRSAKRQRMVSISANIHLPSENSVQSWDSILNKLTGNFDLKFSDVQQKLNDAMQSVKEKQFVVVSSGAVPQAVDLAADVPLTFVRSNGSGSMSNSTNFYNRSPVEFARHRPQFAEQHPQLMATDYMNTVRQISQQKVNTDQKLSDDSGSSAHDESDGSAHDESAEFEPVLCSDRVYKKMKMIEETVKDLREFTATIHERASESVIDSVIRLEFSTKNLPLDYAFGVQEGSKSNFVYARNAAEDDFLTSPYQTTLFPGDIVQKNHKLFVSFPSKQSYILGQNAGVLFSSAIFISMIVGSFGWTMRNLNRHKKISEMKSDFISNMTHEFKTPIATIALASDALRDPVVSTSGERVSRFINVIREENQRLGSQVERVLQAARLERGEIALSKSEIDIHELIEETAQSIFLQVDARGGIITTQLNAEVAQLSCDEIHVRNIILNLLDNANKYTLERPIISVATRNYHQGVLLSVSDNGIGISKENQKKIFEKLYRVPTGNVHNVKGFGLGLSYVQAIVEAHGGNVTIESEPGHGSTFHVYLPFGTIS